MNEENAYNLIDEPWIPVLMQDGTNHVASLGEIFADESGTIADLTLNPYERIAIFRLLLCIAQAAFDPVQIKDENAWRSLRSSVGSASSKYLAQWHEHFYLYGPHAFLQPDCITLSKADGATPCGKLVLHLAAGNKSTLFDHHAITSARQLSDAELARGLLVYQNFSAGGLSGQCVWDGIPTEKSVQGAPCRERSMLITVLLGRTIIETIWLNLVTDDWVRKSLQADWGKPIWELTELSRKATANCENTLLGHLAPLSRAVKLKRGHSACILGEALSYPQLPAWRDPMASIKLQKGAKKDECTETYVATNPARMPWRELSSILAVRENRGSKSALSLRHLETLSETMEFTIWTGGLYSEKAKEVNIVEWKVCLSVGLLEESSMRLYQEAIENAERQLSALKSAAFEYASIMHIDQKETSRFIIPAESIYWDILAQPENQKLVQDINSRNYYTDWKAATRKAAEEAYRRVCPAVSARQMEAFAQGFSKLNIREA